MQCVSMLLCDAVRERVAVLCSVWTCCCVMQCVWWPPTVASQAGPLNRRHCWDSHCWDGQKALLRQSLLRQSLLMDIVRCGVVFQCGAVCCSVLRCLAVSCVSVIHCVEVYCSACFDLPRYIVERALRILAIADEHGKYHHKRRKIDRLDCEQRRWRLRHVTYQWVLSHTNESCHISMSHDTYQWVKWHMNESCDVWMSHMNESINWHEWEYQVIWMRVSKWYEWAYQSDMNESIKVIWMRVWMVVSNKVAGASIKSQSSIQW